MSAADGYKCPGGNIVEPADIEIFSWCLPLPKQDPWLPVYCCGYQPRNTSGYDLMEPCRRKLSVCGTFEIQWEVQFLLIDHREAPRAPANLSYMVLVGDSTINGTARPAPNISRSAQSIRLNLTDLGVHVLAVYLDQVQIPNSPFLFAITKRSCREFADRTADLSGRCICADSSSVDIAGVCLSSFLLLPLCFLSVALVVSLWLCIRRALRSEEDETRRAVDNLRVRLQLTAAEGFILSSDYYPIWRGTRTLIFIQRSYLEAAARLALFREDCDVKLLNGLCVCLLDRPHHYELLCEWLLDICNRLLDTEIEVSFRPPRIPVAARQSQGRSSAAAAQTPALPARRARGTYQRRVQCSFDLHSLKQEERFRYFVEKVCKVQAIRDSMVFERLHQMTQNIMNKLAMQCDKLYEGICGEPMGRQLLESNFFDVVEFDVMISTVATSKSEAMAAARDHFEICRRESCQDDWRSELHFIIDGATISRQDSEQVGAIRVDNSSREEVLLQNEFKTNAQFQPVSEDVFLSQLCLRAELLNQPFQNAVLALVHSHAATDAAIAAAAAVMATTTASAPPSGRESVESNVPKGWELKGPSSVADDGSASSLVGTGSNVGHAPPMLLTLGASMRLGPLAPTLIECQFDDGVDVVEVHQAPVKSLGRMREKLGEYLLPSPKGTWPLSANILDPVRVSLVTQGASHVLQVVRWLLERPGAHGLTVCRLKNGFALPRSEVADGYRDMKLFTMLDGPRGLRLVGEIQVHDGGMYRLKRRMHHLYRIKRAHGPEAI